MAIEKRKYERVAPRGNAFAALGPEYTRFGRIKDISLGGLAFEYISEVGTDSDPSQISIFLIGEVFNLHNIPCKIVYDIPHSVQFQNFKSIKFSSPKRCGVQFGALTEGELSQMKLFIRSQAKNK